MTAHSVRFRTCYEDIDVGGVMYHARYLAFAERARAMAMRDCGLEIGKMLQEQGMGFIIHDISVRYHVPINFDNEFEIRTQLKEMSAARLSIKHQVLNISHGGKLAATMEVGLVMLRTGTMKPTRIPEDYRQKIGKLAEAG